MSSPRAATDAWFLEQLAAPGAATVQRSGARGAMPPLLVRDEREVYRVASGEVTFFVADDVVSATAGDVVVAPAGVQRSFRVESGGARWLVVTRVRSLDRFIDFGRAVSTATAASWPSAAEHAAVAAIAGANGIELIAPPGALPARAPAGTAAG